MFFNSFLRHSPRHVPEGNLVPRIRFITAGWNLDLDCDLQNLDDLDCDLQDLDDLDRDLSDVWKFLGMNIY